MKKNAILLFATLLTASLAIAQTPEETIAELQPTSCLKLLTLEEMVHQDYVNALEALMQGNYAPGLETTVYDTVDGIVLTYTRTPFRADHDALLWFDKSEDGLGNRITLTRSTLDSCLLDEQMAADAFVIDPVTGLFTGSHVYEESETLEEYSGRYTAGNGTFMIQIRLKDERENFIRQKKNERDSIINATVEYAKLLAANNEFFRAIEVLDSVGQAWPLFPTAAELAAIERENVIAQFDEYYFVLLDNATSSNNLELTIRYCDTLLMLTHKTDSVQQIRDISLRQLNGEIRLYSEANPEVFQQVLAQVERFINDEIAISTSKDGLRMQVEFTIKTDRNNESTSKALLWPISSTGKIKKGFKQQISSRNMMFQRNLDSLATSDVIEPVRESNVYVATYEQLKADIRWFSFSETVEDSCTVRNMKLKNSVQYIVDNYFSVYDTQRNPLAGTDLEQVKITKTTHLPSKRLYTFEVKEKTLNNNKRFNDIALTDFKTKGWWVALPSIVWPGAGSTNLGLSESSYSRAIPFWILTGLAAGGYLWETTGDRQTAPRPELGGEGYVQNPLYYKNIGYYLTAVCGTAATIIWTTEMVRSIRCGIRNWKHSSKLREELKRNPIIVETEEIRLR